MIPLDRDMSEFAGAEFRGGSGLCGISYEGQVDDPLFTLLWLDASTSYGIVSRILLPPGWIPVRRHFSTKGPGRKIARDQTSIPLTEAPRA